MANPDVLIVGAGLAGLSCALRLNLKGVSCLMLEASDDSLTLWWRGQFTLAQHRERLKSVANVEITQVPDCGHMLHHDQPQAVARLIELFVSKQ